MADKTTQQILQALRRAAAEPAGAGLHAGRGAAGLFPATAAGKLAAQRCRDAGYLRAIHPPSNGKAAAEVYALTDKGLEYLLSEADPRQLLEDLVRALEGREAQLAELLDRVRAWQSGLADLRGLVERLLPAADPGPTASAAAAVLRSLAGWHAAAATEDCPLPELYRRTRAELAALSVGTFHDTLRDLKEQGRVYLHPWTGPLYALPEPAWALLAGHEVAYYASLRNKEPQMNADGRR